MNTSSKIKVDIDELMETLELISDDDYVTVELEITGDIYNNELNVSAVSFDSEESTVYGTISESSNELI